MSTWRALPPPSVVEEEAPPPRRQQRDCYGHRQTTTVSFGGKMSGTEWVWNVYVRALRQYADRTGSANPPRAHSEQVDGIGEVNLGAWCAYIRRRNTMGRLPEARRREVESVSGWSWSVAPQRNVQRENEIVHLRRDKKMTLREIAGQYGISRQRVHAVLRKLGATDKAGSQVDA